MQSLESKQPNPPKALDQTEGLIAWKPVANTKGQRFDLCTAWHCLCALNEITFFMEEVGFIYLFCIRETVIRVAKKWHKQMFRPSDVRRGGQLLLRPVAFRALYKDVYTLVSFPFSYNTIHLEKPGFHKNICRKENLGIQPSGNMGHNVRKYLELLKDQGPELFKD